jgi:hypothetical protein
MEVDLGEDLGSPVILQGDILQTNHFGVIRNKEKLETRTAQAWSYITVRPSGRSIDEDCGALVYTVSRAQREHFSA